MSNQGDGVTFSRKNDSKYKSGRQGSFVSIGIVILTVELGGLGSFVSRNNDYI